MDGVQAQSSEHTTLGDKMDCSNISIDYTNDPNLTKQEKIALMDKALLHSLNKYEGCQHIRTSAAANENKSDRNQSDRNQSDRNQSNRSQTGSGQSGESIGTGTSTASSEMTGSQKPSTPETPINQSTRNMTTKATTDKHRQNTPIKGSGAVPSDIPPVNNDSTLEAQIRQAAMNETDPIIKAKLWNEYRKYKGLPLE
ncbi:MAG: hypothetical protein Q9M14_07490 [Mariprofundaceae bacterium]|nr:hypothetical protein [Mariprofundaceae bacterium]